MFFSWISNSDWAELENNYTYFPPNILIFKLLILEVSPLQDVKVWQEKHS